MLDLRSVEGRHQKFNMFEVLKVSSLSQDIDISLRQKQLEIYRADMRIREREGIGPDRRQVRGQVSKVFIRAIKPMPKPSSRINCATPKVPCDSSFPT